MSFELGQILRNVLVQKADVKSEFTGLIYPEAILRDVAEKLNKRTGGGVWIMGEIESPFARLDSEFSVEKRNEGFATVNLEKVSHLILNPRYENGGLYVDVKPLDTFYGRQLVDLLSDGAEVSFSLRSMVRCGFDDPDQVVEFIDPVTIDVRITNEQNIQRIYLDMAKLCKNLPINLTVVKEEEQKGIEGTLRDGSGNDSEVTHHIKSLQIKDGKTYARIKMMSTERGRLASAILDQPIKENITYLVRTKRREQTNVETEKLVISDIISIDIVNDETP